MRKKKLSRFDARETAEKMGVNFGKEYFSQNILTEMFSLGKLMGYKKPRNSPKSYERHVFETLKKVY